MRDAEHLPAWADFNKRVGANGDFGIWHETFLVKAGQYEAVYNNMPEFGLARAGAWVRATGKQNTARGWLSLSDGRDEPVYEEEIEPWTLTRICVSDRPCRRLQFRQIRPSCPLGRCASRLAMLVSMGRRGMDTYLWTYRVHRTDSRGQRLGWTFDVFVVS